MKRLVQKLMVLVLAGFSLVATAQMKPTVTQCDFNLCYGGGFGTRSACLACCGAGLIACYTEAQDTYNDCIAGCAPQDQACKNECGAERAAMIAACQIDFRACNSCCYLLP